MQSLVTEKGLFSFYEDGHGECCGIRKVEPLRRKLQTLDAWITGQRRDQSPGTRNEVPVVQLDDAFEGRSGELVKFNPLANWTSRRSGTISVFQRRPTTSSMSGALSASVASPAHARCSLDSTNGRAAGGGKKPPRRNADCTLAT